jgi:HK97 gp10 family phage protein
MANRVSMKLEGLTELNRALMALTTEVKKGPVVMRALHDGARVIAAEARKLAPVLQDPGRNRHRQPGAIRAGITQHASKTEDFAVVVRVRSRGWIFGSGPDTRKNGKSARRAGNPNYWWLVEFGTSKMAARPFMRPAFEAKKFQAAMAIRESLKRGIDYIANQVKSRIAA